MNDKPEIENAIIESVKFDTERGLTIWVYLKFGSSGQGFGGYLLYAPDGWSAHNAPGNYCGHFVHRLFQIAEVDEWSKLQGRAVRARHTWNSVEALGHIIKDDWFDPKKEFDALTAKCKQWALHEKVIAETPIV